MGPPWDTWETLGVRSVELAGGFVVPSTAQCNMHASPPPPLNSCLPSAEKRTAVTWLECPPYTLPLPPSAGYRNRLTCIATTTAKES